MKRRIHFTVCYLLQVKAVTIFLLNRVLQFDAEVYVLGWEIAGLEIAGENSLFVRPRLKEYELWIRFN